MPSSAGAQRSTTWRWHSQALHIIRAGLGVFAAISVIGALTAFGGHPWLLGSFGASCVLLFGFPASPFSRVRNVLGGHFIASFIGLTFLHVLGPSWWSMAAAASCAAMAMMATDTVHPPAGSNPLIIFLAQPSWSFLWLPTVAGACLLLTLSWGFRAALHQLDRNRANG